MKKLLLTFCAVLLLVGCTEKEKEPNDTNTNNDEINLEEAFEEMEADMLEYYEQYYADIKGTITEERKEITFKVNLANLESLEYDVSEFKHPETGEACDLQNSFAYIYQTPNEELYPDQEYVIQVYFTCGGYQNREYPSAEEEEE